MNGKSSKIRCWNQKGVWGDSSCPRLSTSVHCAKCDVYTDAGKEIFEREIPKDYFKTWGDTVDTFFVPTVQSGESYFSFRCAGRIFALPYDAVSELVSMRMIHKIPYRRNGATLGLVNINGELVVAVDIPTLFSFGGRLENPKYIIVCSNGSDKFAFPVDFVRGAVTPDLDTLTDTNSDDAWYISKYFELNGERVSLINYEILMGAVTKKRL